MKQKQHPSKPSKSTAKHGCHPHPPWALLRSPLPRPSLRCPLGRATPDTSLAQAVRSSLGGMAVTTLYWCISVGFWNVFCCFCWFCRWFWLVWVCIFSLFWLVLLDCLGFWGECGLMHSACQFIRSAPT